MKSLIPLFDQVDIQPAMTSLIVDEFSHAIDFYRNIIGMRKVFYFRLTELMFSSNLDILLMFVESLTPH